MVASLTAMVALCKGLQGGDQISAGSSRAGEGIYRGNWDRTATVSVTKFLFCCWATRNVGFAVFLKGPWSQVDVTLTGWYFGSAKGKSISAGEVAFVDSLPAGLTCMPRAGDLWDCNRVLNWCYILKINLLDRKGLVLVFSLSGLLPFSLSLFAFYWVFLLIWLVGFYCPVMAVCSFMRTGSTIRWWCIN